MAIPLVRTGSKRKLNDISPRRAIMTTPNSGMDQIEGCAIVTRSSFMTRIGPDFENGITLNRLAIPGPASARGLLLGVLVALIAVQVARLVWVTVRPLGPVGDWSLTSLTAGKWPRAGGEPFNPFSRAQAVAAPSTVTSLALKLFGVRVDERNGLGAAIIATPDGVQSSFAVGDTVMPGVTLKAVAFDHAVLTNGGREESIYLDQSVPTTGAPAPVAGAAPAAPAGQVSIATLQSSVDIAPRMQNGKPSGLTLSPRGDGAAYRAAGFQAGDVLVSLNGKPVTSLSELTSIPTTGEAMLLVERAGSTVSIPLKGNQ